MFRYLIFLLLSLLTCADIAAQYTPFFIIPEGEKKRTFYGGVAVGMNCSQVDGDTYSGYHKAGINLGPLVYLRFNRMLSLSTELLYTRKGSKAKSYQSTVTGVPYLEEYSLKLNYVEIPVVAHLFVRGRIHYGVGMSYARLINWKEEAYTIAPVNIHPEVNYFKKDDLCGIAEVSYELFKQFFVNVRFNYSLRTIRDPYRIPEGYGNGKSGQQLNNMWSLRFIYLVK